MEEIYINTQQLAERWGFSRFTLEAWRFKKKGPPYTKRGYRSVVYKLDDIIEFEHRNPGFVRAQPQDSQAMPCHERSET